MHCGDPYGDYRTRWQHEIQREIFCPVSPRPVTSNLRKEEELGEADFDIDETPTPLSDHRNAMF
ncbi:hypothetical protein PG993_011296 [Apiospora rasikravindrae]|uniref:Uncharacterized protein n=1 Tax=Apiospora rasikravindrae TaxID=990691 RepID=A0ABR1SDT6_9PEZI